MSIATDSPSFSPALFGFLEELAANNDRDWFNANKARYVEAVQEPALAFIEDVGLRLPQVSSRFVADVRTNGGSLFRIYRDTRFSKDKTPYKTHTGIHFRHETARTAHAPVYYLHLEPGNAFFGAGIWRPDSEPLRQIREAIARRPDRWTAIQADPAFAARFSLEGERLKRPPAGFDPDHPQIEEIKRKSFVAMAPLSQKTVTGRGFLDEWDGLCRDSMPLMRFICEALGVAF
jgi:uncharacterized protein (TIGR02453 family)